MIKVKNAASVAKKSEKGTMLYYDIEKGTVNTSGNGHFVTMLMRKNTAQEIRDAVYRWSMM